MFAGVLINESFGNWSSHPVSSVISTHPIKDLKFPNVTICPPKGTNTALNYDLFKLQKNFTSLEKNLITKEIINAFFDVETKTYVKTISDLVNEENFANIYRGFQPLPTQSTQNEYTVKLYGEKGEICVKGSENKDNIHYILEFPKNLQRLIGRTGKLVVEVKLELETSTLHYREGPKFWTPALRSIGPEFQNVKFLCNLIIFCGKKSLLRIADLQKA